MRPAKLIHVNTSDRHTFNSFMAELVDAKLAGALTTDMQLMRSVYVPIQGFVIPVNIRVTDANDNAPHFVNAPYVLNISEVGNTTNIAHNNEARGYIDKCAIGLPGGLAAVGSSTYRDY
jgi:hypothetical protein